MSDETVINADGTPSQTTDTITLPTEGFSTGAVPEGQKDTSTATTNKVISVGPLAEGKIPEDIVLPALGDSDKDDEKDKDSKPTKDTAGPTSKPSTKPAGQKTASGSDDDKKTPASTTSQQSEEPLGPFAPPEEIIKATAEQKPRSRDEVLEAILGDSVSSAEKEHLKRMSNEAFDIVTKRLERLQQLEAQLPKIEEQVKQLATQTNTGNNGQLPPSWYEHPEAYKLSPAYQERVKSIETLRSEYAHWREQLAKIENGEDWVDYVQQGDKWVAVTKPATTQAKIDVTAWMTNALNHISREEQQLGTLQQHFQSYHKNLIESVRNAEKQFFPDYLQQGEKHPSWSAVKATYEYLSKNGLGNDLLAPMVSMMYARLLEYRKALQALQTKYNAASSIAVDKQKAGPASSTAVTGASSADDGKMLSLDMFRMR